MITIAKNGYEGSYGDCGPVMWIDGKLYQAIRPVSSPGPLWVPVRHYGGPVTYADKRGRPCPAPAEDAGEGEGNGN